MSKGSSSCLKFCLGCCAGVVVLIVLIAAFSIFYVKSNQLDTPVFEEISEIQQFESHEIQGVVLSELPQDIVPINIVVEAEFCSLTLAPDAPHGTVKVEGECDSANGQFEFITNNQPDQKELTVSYRSSKSLFFNLGNEHADDVMNRNHLIVHLPVDSAINLTVIHNKGSLDMDFSGIPLNYLNINSHFSEVEMRNMIKNPLVLSEFFLEQAMGELKLRNFENFRFSTMNFDFSMGDFTLSSNGLFYRSAAIHMDSSMFSGRIEFPENVKIINQLKPRSGKVFITEQPQLEKNVEVTLEGDCAFGELTIAQ